MSFRTNLQALRSQRNMTQEQLAMLVGVSRQAVSKWESDKAYPEMDKLLAICDLFGCTLDDLVLGDVRRPGSGQGASQSGGGAMGGQDRGLDGQVQGSGRHDDPRAQDLAGRDGGAPDQPEAVSPSSPAQGWGGNGRGSSTIPQAAPARPTMPLPSTMEDVTGYASFSNVYSLRMAFGVAAILLGLAFSGLFAGGSHPTDAQNGLALLSLMIGVALGLACLLPAASARKDFRRRHPYVADFYTDEERSQASRQTTWEQVCGLALILLDVAITSAGFLIWGWSNQVRGFVFFTLLAFGVLLLVHSGTSRRMMNIKAWNEEGEHDEYGPKKSGEYGILASFSISGIIMVLCTVVALIMLFSGNRNNFLGFHIPFWAFWVIGGVACGVVQALIGIFRRPPRA